MNKTEIPEKNTLQLLQDEVLSPIYIFQVENLFILDFEHYFMVL